MSHRAPEFVIEPCPEARDAEAIAFLRRVFYDELGFTPDPRLDKDFAGLVPHYRRGRGEIWIALENDTIIATTAIFDLEHPRAPGAGLPSGGDAELKRMFIDRSRRGLGLGRRLLDVAVERAAEAGFDRMVLDTKLEMRAALGLYRSAGFEEIPDHNGNQRAEVFMARRLRPERPTT